MMDKTAEILRCCNLCLCTFSIVGGIGTFTYVFSKA